MKQSGCDGDNRPGLFQVLALARLSYLKLLRLWVWLTILDQQKSGWVETKHTHTHIRIHIYYTTVILLYIYLVLYVCNISSTHNRQKWPLVGLVGPIGSDPLPPPKGRHGLPCESCGAALCWPSMALPWRFPVDFPWNQSEHRTCLCGANSMVWWCLIVSKWVHIPNVFTCWIKSTFSHSCGLNAHFVGSGPGGSRPSLWSLRCWRTAVAPKDPGQVRSPHLGSHCLVKWRFHGEFSRISWGYLWGKSTSLIHFTGSSLEGSARKMQGINDWSRWGAILGTKPWGCHFLIFGLGKFGGWL